MIRKRFMQTIAGILVFIIAFTNCYTEDTFAAGNKGTDNKKTESVHVDKKRSNPKTDIIIKYKDKTKESQTVNGVKTRKHLKKFDKKKYFKNQGVGVYEINETDDLDAVINDLNSDPNVEYAQPNYPLEIEALTTDDMLDNQWAIYNDGQEVDGYAGRATVDINAALAWEKIIENNEIVIGVMDTGIQTEHTDLNGNIFTNIKEIPVNGIDDDGNGYIDDVNGWDFVNDDASVYDSVASDSHGTYVSGIIAAKKNNGGIVGVAPDVKLLPLKFINGSIGYTSDAIESIEYAMNMGVKIVNCSFGGTDNNQALMDAMSNSGMLFICAAGNRGADTMDKPIYPAAFNIDNVLSVTSIDNTGIIPSFASYGNDVDVAAPGVTILSTVPDNKCEHDSGYDYFTGTSASAAIVSGIAALTENCFPEDSVLLIKQRIIDGVTKCASLNSYVASGGRVDANAALTGSVRAYDPYTGKSNADDILPTEGEGESDTWYVMNELASNAERFHYGEGGVNPASGNYSVTCTDMSIAAPGFTVQISRSYNSRNQKQTLLGRGWTFGFEGKITDKADSIEISLPNGSCYTFNIVNGSYIGEATRASFANNVNGVDILTTSDQYKYGFDSSTNKMIYMEDKNGNRINLIYSDNKLDKITDTVGREYKLSYNSDNLLSAVTDPAGRQVTYTYNSKNLLYQVTDPEGGILTYEYDVSQYLINQIDQFTKSFQKIKYSHDLGDAENKVIETTDAAGATWSYCYDPADFNMTITNNDDKKWTYWFNFYMDTIKVLYPDGKCTLTVYDYDNSVYYGDVLAREDRDGNRTEYEVDVNTGNTTKVINPDGSVKTFAYDRWNNVIEEVNETGNKTFYIYDANGADLLWIAKPLNGKDAYIQGDTTNFAVTAYTYYSRSEAISKFNCDAAGLLKEELDPMRSRKSYTYDNYANIASITDTLGTTYYKYDSIGQKQIETTAKGNITRWEYDGNGQVIRVINPDEGVKRTVYDAAGRIKLEVEPNLYNASLDNLSTDAYTGTAGTAYDYYTNGYLWSVTDAAGNKTEYVYDNYGNITNETKPNGAIYHYEYDLMNRLIRTSFQESVTDINKVIINEISYSTLNNGNSQTTTTVYASDNQKNTTISVKDYAGREVLAQYGDYIRTQTVYNPDGTIKQTTAANGASTYYAYDCLGNRTVIRKPVAVVDGYSMYSLTQLKYDQSGKLISEKTAKPLFTGPSENEDENIYTNTALSSLAPTDIYEKTYTYSGGLMTEQSDSEGRSTTYVYDSEGRASKITQQVSPTEVQVAEYDYNYLSKPKTVTRVFHKGDMEGYGYDDKTNLDIVTAYEYDYNGNLTSITDAENNLTTYTYNNLNRLLETKKQLKNDDGTITDIANSQTYTWDGKIASATDARNYTTYYSYDNRGNQTRIEDPLGNVTYKIYDRAGNNIAVVSPKNHTKDAVIEDMDDLKNLEHTEFTYDEMGRVIKQTEIYQKMTLDESFAWTRQWVNIITKTYSYDALGNITSATDALNNTTKTDYNLAGQVDSVTDAETAASGLSFTVKYEYNGLGQKIKEVYPGAAYDYTYDGAGNLLSTQVNSIPKSTVAYDYLGRATSSTDGRGNTTTMSWNAFGKVSRVNTPGDTTIPPNRTIYQYDRLGNLTYTKDGTGKVTTYTYDSLGRNTSQTVGNEAGMTSIKVQTKYDNNGNITARIDGNNYETDYEYNENNKLKNVKNPNGQTTTYDYDANGNQTSMQDYLGNTTTREYDGINRLVEVRDALKNVVQQIIYNDADAQTSSFDALHNETKFLYDRNLRQTGTIDAEGNTSSVTYDTRGNVKTKTDGNNNTTAYEYDGENRLICVTDSRGNKTLYSYDAAGDLASQTDGNGNTTTFTYNAANLITAKIDPAGNGDPGRTESYTYYANGLMAEKTDCNGVTTIYAYDIFGRKTSEDAGGEIQTYAYDNNGNLTEMTDSTGTTIRKYDELNRNIEKTVPGIGLSKYDYDIESAVAGRYCERTTDPKGNVTLKTYDQAGRLAAVTVGEETTTYEYQPNGNRSKVTYPDGTTETYTYDSDNRVTSLINEKSGGIGYSSSVISSYSYTYDDAGNQLTKMEAKGTTSYTYDSLNRLESVTEPEGKVTTYTYDGAGNRKTEKVQFGLMGSDILYNYDNRNRLISTISMGGAYTRYIYDNNGNQVGRTSGIIEPLTSGTELSLADLPNFGLIIKRVGENGTGSGDITRYTYDKYNRMTRTISGNTSSSYLYNAQGYRAQKTVNGKTTRYLYEGDKVVLETDQNNEQTAFMAYGSNLLYRTVTGEGEAAGAGEAAAQSYYYLYNAHGDVTSLIDADGNIAVTYDYDAFGNILNKTGDADNSIRYAGYQYDEESGLYYLNARYYDSVTARFISEDTYRGQANDPLSLNLYTYCSNNPIKYTDPTGHWGTTVHTKDTRTWATEEFYQYINDEAAKIDIYKRDNKGNIIYKKGKAQIDPVKRDARDQWVKDQKDKVGEYVDALVAGDRYVDQEQVIFKRQNFYYDGIFHGLNGNKLTNDNLNKKNNPYNFITERKDTAGAILTNSKYNKDGAINTYIVNPVIDILKKQTNALKNDPASILNINRDMTDKAETKKVGKKTTTITTNRFEDAKTYDTATKYMAEKETASLFVLGMGLHSLQDVQAHGMQATPHKPADPNDNTTVDSWYYDKKENLITTEGTSRIDQTKEDTQNYIHTFLYGDGTEDNPGYGSYLFTPYTPPETKKK